MLCRVSGEGTKEAGTAQALRGCCIQRLSARATIQGGTGCKVQVPGKRTFYNVLAEPRIKHFQLGRKRIFYTFHKKCRALVTKVFKLSVERKGNAFKPLETGFCSLHTTILLLNLMLAYISGQGLVSNPFLITFFKF